MSLRDLHYLVAVADHQHFGRAAAACFVSQPALSMQLRKLEESLGVQFFERSNKRFMVTPVGKIMVAMARDILRDAKSMKDIAQTYHNPLAGDFRLGAFPTLSPYFFPQVVPKITLELPKLKLFLVEEKTQVLLDRLKSGELDAVCVALPIEDNTLEVVELFQDPFVLALPKTHALAARQQVTYADIKNENLLLLEEGHCLREQALSVCDLMGVSEYQDFRATSLETLRQMVRAGVGMTLMPKLAQKEDDGVAYVSLASPGSKRIIGLVWRKNASRQVSCEQIAEIIKATMAGCY
jgi:LysR family transcriptional regulator, hydrogen peroxide-inducible genes activator